MAQIRASASFFLFGRAGAAAENHIRSVETQCIASL